VAEAQALAMYERYTPDGHGSNGHGPVDVLAELGRLVAEVRRFADFTGARVAALTAGDWRPDEPRAAAELALYERALDRAGRLLTEVTRLGLEDVGRERAMRDYWVARRVGERAAAIMRAVFTDLMDRHLAPDPRDPAVADIVVRRIRQMEPQ
jgi:hypothetical protein